MSLPLPFCMGLHSGVPEGAWISWRGFSHRRSVDSAWAAARGGCPGCPTTAGESDPHRCRSPGTRPASELKRRVWRPLFALQGAFLSNSAGLEKPSQSYKRDYVKRNLNKGGREFEGHFIPSKGKPVLGNRELSVQDIHAPSGQRSRSLVSVRHRPNLRQASTLPSLCWSSYSQTSIPLTIHHLTTCSDVTFQKISPVAASPVPRLNQIPSLLSIIAPRSSSCVCSMSVSSTSPLAHDGTDRGRLPTPSAPLSSTTSVLITE